MFAISGLGNEVVVPDECACGRPEAEAHQPRLVGVGTGPQKSYTVQQQPPAGSCHYRYEKGEPLEDPECRPGAISLAVLQANLRSTICRKGGYTSDIRPSTSVTGKEKVLNAASYGYKGRVRPPDQPAARGRSERCPQSVGGAAGPWPQVG
ncbi:hypothetical protein [Streptomyces sp. NPDC059349]|uniref:hypothetical protein n=1 Tax=Streptomyces sp. NPDC059349 TaxID=3346808 RepID=UPI0036952FEC